jgi:hypothetical protein
VVVGVRLVGDKPLYIYTSPYMRTKQVRPLPAFVTWVT